MENCKIAWYTDTVAEMCAMNKRNFASRLPCGPFAKRTFRIVRYQSLTVRYNSTSRIAYFYQLSTIDSIPLCHSFPMYRSFVRFT